jgi:hypothetical protein
MKITIVKASARAKPSGMAMCTSFIDEEPIDKK